MLQDLDCGISFLVTESLLKPIHWCRARGTQPLINQLYCSVIFKYIGNSQNNFNIQQVQICMHQMQLLTFSLETSFSASYFPVPSFVYKHHRPHLLLLFCPPHICSFSQYPPCCAKLHSSHISLYFCSSAPLQVSYGVLIFYASINHICW